MSWQILLKAQPQRQVTLLFILSDDAKTDALVEEIKNSEKLTTNFKGLVDNLRSNNITVDSMMQKLPIPNLSKEKVEANLKKVLDSITPEQSVESKKLETLLEEAISAKKDEDDDKFQELSVKINQMKGKSASTLKRNKKLRAKLRVFESYSDGFVLEFNAVPKSGSEKQKFLKILEEFGKTFGATVVGDTLQTTFPNVNAFLNDGKVMSEENAELRKKIMTYDPDLEGKEGKLSSVSETDTMLASNMNYEVVEPFTSYNVEQLILALEQIGGDVSKFIPKEMENGFEFPKEAVILERGSGRKNSLALNPYGKIIMSASFSENSWFQEFFSAIRMNAFVSSKLSERMHIEAIISGLNDQSNPEKSSLGVNLIPFRDLQLTNNKKQDMAKIRSFIEGDRGLKEDLDSSIEAYQRNVFQDKYEDKFTAQEAKTFEKIYNETEDAEYIWGDELQIEYYDKLDVPTSESKRPTSYAKIFIDDEETSPKEIMEDINKYEKEKNVKIGLGNLRQVLLDTSDFAQFIVNYSNEEDGGLEALTRDEASSAAFLDKLSPKNSLIVLSRLGEAGILDDGSTDGIVAEAFIQIDENKGDTNKQIEIANELNKSMGKFLKEAKIQLISGFQKILEDFTKNYENFFPYKQSNVPIAVKEFKKRELIR
jgi:hypothetical protein